MVDDMAILSFGGLGHLCFYVSHRRRLVAS